ncbi:CusA/CzcA family heavy metal efflux RND transporter [Aquifex aeolicus]|uniref:Cation efflux system (AcrB/AcrD/AcrF family) n=1 Tax=Aquifex aeolicus (strain VF5) TaxID=224324 RepID=O66770_AQUAE|nr:CusA/CzcA family heavy metal efflux RND transporter [Aquifex aeolicus]AAC06724.1 cation efflux system (AcrB/AcrD/AcrF family) [Aquifex aeolicus VF5]
MFRAVLKYRLLVLIALVGTVIYGVYSFKKLPIDAFPDPTPVQVNIYTEAPGLSAEEVETLITIPVESVMNGIKDVELVRSVSLPGLSYVSVYFKEGTDVYFARRLVMEKLPDAKERIPEGFNPVMGPNSTGLGNVLVYVLYDTSGKYTPQELKSIFQQWVARPLIMSAGGVEEIVQFGPELAYVIVPDFEKLIAYGITLEDLLNALERNNLLVGGGFYQSAEGDLVVRGLGRVYSKEDLLRIPVKVDEEKGVSVYLRDVAKVVEGEVPNRRGAFTMNGQEVQGNIVVKRIYENTKEVVDKVKEKLKEIQKILPEGVKIEHLYDQAYLTEKAVSTIQKALFSGMLLVAIVTAFLMGNFRTSLIVISSLPLTLLIAFIVMKETGMSGNLMTLGGLAIGIGMFVDSSVVVVENVYRHLTENKSATKFSIILDSLKEVWRPVLFAVLIIVIVFSPIFVFESVEGKFFKPLAMTLIIALLASLFVAFTFIPALSYYFLKPGKETYSKLMRAIHKVYEKVLDFTFKLRTLLYLGVFISFVFSLFLLTRIGTEFAPELEEGAVIVKAFLDPNVSLEEGKRVATAIEREAMKFPEVIRTFSTVGRAEKGEAADVNYIETWILLKPQSEWETFKTREEFNEILRKRLEWLPASLGFTQPIKMRIDELLSGVRADIAIKIFGQDPEVLNELADKVKEIAESVPGAVDVQKEIQAGRLQLRIYPKWEVLERYGITVEEVLDVVKYNLGGAPVGELQKDTLLFPIVMTLPEDFRGDVSKLAKIPLFERHGKILTFGDVADLKVEPGLFVIRRENNIRFALVMLNVEGRDTGSFVKELQSRIENEVKLPTGYFITYGGQFENQQRAMKKLSIAVPVSIFLIFVMLYLNFNSVRDALVVMLNVPFAVIGGIIALYISGFNLSVPSAIGFIAIFGVATLNGVVLVSYIRQLLQEELEIREAVKRAAILRIRPILITAITTLIGLIPLLVIRDIGSEVQRPLATVVVGGIFTSTLLTLIILPSVYELVYRKFPRA